MKLKSVLPILAISFTQIARAATFTSTGTGVWSNPASWTAGVGFPNTYTADDALIAAGTVISYDGSIPNIGGNLAVANGHSITINGGTLNQTWAPGAPPPYGTAIAIGVSGSASGAGTLNINAAGLFDSGTANVVVVGVTSAALGGAAGNGTVNVNDGTFRMGVASSATGGLGLAIGIDAAAVGAFNLGNGVGAANTAVLDLSTNNSLLTIGGRQTAATGGTGTMTILADGQLNQGTRSIVVGDNLGTGFLLLNGGTIQGGTGDLSIGTNGGTGTLTLTAGALSTTGEFNVGRNAGSNGTANFNGGTASTGQIVIGRDGGTGAATVAGATLTANGNLYVGNGGNGAGGVGTLTISSGTVHATGFTRIGDNNGGGATPTGTLVISGGALNSDDYIAIGSDGGVGQVNQTGGTVTFNNWLSMGLGGGAAGSSWNISGGNITSGAGIEVGSDRDATMNISGGGNVSVGNYSVGVRGGSNGHVTISGGTLTTGSIVIAGRQDGASTGDMTVSGGVINLNGGGVNNVDNDFTVGNKTGASGLLNVSGGTINFNGHHLVVGGNQGTATGVVNITAGTLNNVGWFHVGSTAGSTGTVNINLTNPAGVVAMNSLYLGNNNATGTVTVTSGTMQVTDVGEVGRYGGTGTLNVSGANAHVIAASAGGDPFFKVGREGGHGIVNISAGASLHTTNTWFTLGENNSLGEATVTGAGSTLHSNGLILGWGGTGVGILNIADNAVVTNVGHELSIGRDTGVAKGTINITSGGILNAGPETRIGHQGIGVVNINGGTMNMQGGGWAMLGEGGSANGTLNMSAGAVNVTANDFVLGTNTGAVGTYNQSGGATQVINLNVGRGGATGSLNLSGGTFNASGWTTIGRDGNGTGTINVSGTGVFNHLPSGGGDFLIGWNNGSHGAVNVTAGGTINYNWWVRAAIDPGSTGSILVSGAGSTMNMDTGRIYIGEQGTGTLTVSAGGHFVQTNGDQFNIGGNDGSSTGNGFGTMTVTGAGSLVSTNNFIRAGFGNTGAVPAVGEMNINSGGTVSSGGWIGIGHEGGDGTLNMNGGTITTGNELYVGIDDNGHTRQTTGLANVGGGSTLNVGALYIGRNGGAGTFNLNGGTMTIHREARIGGGGIGSGGLQTSGTLNITGVGSNVAAFTDGGTDFFRVGHGGGRGVINITGGGTLTTNAGWFTLGENDNSTGTALVRGTGSSLHSNGLIVGWNGSGVGTLSIQNNAVVTNVGHEVSIGRDNGNTVGIINLASGGTLNSSQDAMIGHNGFGTVNLAGGNWNNTGGWVYVGTEAASHGTVNMGAGSTFADAGQLIVGNNGAQGVFNQTGGTTNIAQEFNLGRTGGHGTLNLSGGTFNVNGWTTMGKDGGSGDGTLNVSNTGVFNHPTGLGGDFLIGWTNGSRGAVNVTNGGKVNYGWWTRVGVDPGSTGSILVDGAGSVFTVGDGRVYIGEKSTGTLTITNGGVFTHHSGYEFGVGEQDGPAAGGTGTITVGGAGSTLNNDNFIRVGHGNTGAVGGVGIVNLSAGGTINAGNWMGFGHEGGDGTLNMSGGAINFANEFYVGIDDNGHTRTTTGVANITGGAITQTGGGAGIFIGRNGGVGTVNLSGAGATTLTSLNEVNIGQGGVGAGGAVSTGTLNMNNANAVISSVNGFWIGRDSGSGFLIQSAGSVSGGDIRIGTTGAASGTVALSGGTLTAVRDLTVGWQNSAVGNLTVTGGAINVGTDAYIGVRDTAAGNFYMSAGTMTVARDLYIAADAGTTGNVQFDGGTIQARDFVYAGGTASVNFNGGTVKAGQNQGDFFIGFNPGMSEVQAGGLIFNSNSFTAVANNSFDGVGRLTKTGNGTLALTAANTYAGGTVINAGTLNINANAALGALGGGVAINNNATLQAAANVTSNRTVTLGAGGGQIDTNSQTVTLDTSSTVTGTALTKVGNGTLNIKGTQTYAALTTTGGVTNLFTALGTGSSTLTANATTKIYVSQKLAALTIGAGAEFTFGDGLPFAPAAEKGEGLAAPLAASAVVPEPGSFGLLPVGEPEKIGAPALVPEPGSLALIMVGAVGALGRRRRARR